VCQQLFLKPFLTHFEVFRAVAPVGRRADNRTLRAASPGYHDYQILCVEVPVPDAGPALTALLSNLFQCSSAGYDL